MKLIVSMLASLSLFVAGSVLAQGFEELVFQVNQEIAAAARAVLHGNKDLAAGGAGIEWVRIHDGEFIMGSNAPDGERDETPAHSVTIQAFDIARTEVTIKQYKDCVEAGRCAPIDATDCLSDAFYADDSQPVVCVTWHQAKAFSEWVGGRLPTEAEWEYAARNGGKDAPYPWGPEEPNPRKAVFRGESQATRPVCSTPEGNTQQGLCDMAGNAWEWVEDVYHGSYEGAPEDGRAWVIPSFAPYRVMRGGSWNVPGTSLRVANRAHDFPGGRFKGGVGFRPAKRSR